MSDLPADEQDLRLELERSRRYFQQLFDIVPCYITIQDRDLTIQESNRLFRQDFGECTGGKCYRAYKGHREVCHNCPVEKTFADGQIHSSEETVTTRDGRQANMIVYSMPVRDDNGEIHAVMEVSTNITQVKDLQRQLALVGMAVTGLAHRIKNILMGLEGGIFVVNTGFEDQDQAVVSEGWEMVQRNVAKISRLAKDLLFCSKERQPKLTIGVSPKQIASEVHSLYRPRLEEEQIDFVLEFFAGEDIGTYDPGALQTLMENLVANALDACRFEEHPGQKQHRICLRCGPSRDGHTVVIEVGDNGPGIPKQDSHRLFEGFFSSKGTEGTGLGLLVVQRVVEEHDGQIAFETAAGRGTTFIVTLPRRPGSDRPG